jgi:hypothetical protein
MLAAVAALVPAGRPAEAAVPPQLSITLTDGVAQTRSGQSLTYTATVTNGGAKQVKGKLVLEVPAFTSAGHAKHSAQTVTWTMTARGDSTVTRKATVKVHTIPKGMVRVTTLASVYLGATSGVPVIRTADADRIAGVPDPTPVTVSLRPSASPTKRPAAVSAQDGNGASLWLAAGLPIVIAAGLAAGALVWWRRRRAPERS